MFSSQLGRVARASSNGLASTTIPATHRTAGLATSATPSFQPKLRRLSSSKASSSSSANGNSNGAKPIANAAESDAPATNSKSSGSGRRGGSGRRARDVSVKAKKSVQAEVEGEADGAFDGLPRVAETGHLHPNDISLSSFFSLHRPLSLSTPLPPITTQESFASLFDSKAKPASNNPNDVMYTIGNTIDALDPHSQTAQQDSQDLHWQVIQESTSNTNQGVKHLDGAPPHAAKSLEEMVSQLRPFMAPPPPTAEAKPASTASATAAEKKAKKAASATTAAAEEKGLSKKSFQTTITVTENTSAEGVTYYTANSTPMVRIPSSQNSNTTSQTPVQDALQRQHHGQPFLERMRERQLAYEDYRAEREEENSMQLISVKRQRKLKMKKHKYKKLMKRTRNLRRRLDRN